MVSLFKLSISDIFKNKNRNDRFLLKQQPFWFYGIIKVTVGSSDRPFENLFDLKVYLIQDDGAISDETIVGWSWWYLNDCTSLFHL